MMECIEDLIKSILSGEDHPSPERIRSLRTEARLTQVQAGILTESSVRAWQDWEYGRRKMSKATWLMFRIKLFRGDSQ